MNDYVTWLLRIALVAVPLTYVVSWHYDVRSAALLERFNEINGYDALDDGYGTFRTSTMRAAGLASDAAVFWGRMFNIAIGALGGTATFAAVRRRRMLANAIGLKRALATSRYRRRRRRLLSARHPSTYSDIYLGWAILSLVASVATIALEARFDSRPGLPVIDAFLHLAAVGIFVASTWLAMRAFGLAARGPASLGNVVRILGAGILIVIDILGWMAGFGLLLVAFAFAFG